MAEKGSKSQLSSQIQFLFRKISQKIVLNPTIQHYLKMLKILEYVFLVQKLDLG